MRLTTLIALAACHHESAPPVIAPVPVAAPVVVPVDAAIADAAAVAEPRPSPPLAGVRLGFDPAAWRVTDARSLAFCPTGLVVVDERDGIHRFDTRGHEVGKATVTGARDARLVECRADGTALVVAAGRAVLIGLDGATQISPIEVRDARFSDDGVHLLTADALLVWDGTHAPAELRKIGVHAPSTLVTGGAYLFANGPHLTLARPGKPPLELGEVIADFAGVTAAPDGTIAGLADRRARAVGFTIDRDVPHRVALWEQIGMGLLEVRISNKWVAILGTGRELAILARPTLARTVITSPCGGDLAQAIALGDDRVAVGCESGVRIFALPSGELVARADARHVALAWSPDGKQLATLEEQGRIDIWKGLEHASTIDSQRGSFAWWRGAELVGNTILQGGARRLRVWKGASVTDERTRLTMDYAAATPSGEVALLAAHWPRAKQPEVPLLALDVRGAITELPIPDPALSDLIAVAISPDGKRGVALRSPRDHGSLLLVDVAKHLVTPSDVHADVVAVGNTQIAIAQDTRVTLLDGTALAERISPITQLAYAPDGARLAIASRDGTIAIAGGAEWRGDGSEIAAIAWSPDGAQLAIATGLATYLWSAR